MKDEKMDDEKKFVMVYNTFGSCGQHDAKHPLFIVNGQLLTAEEATEKGIVTEEIMDNHSTRNLHYKRVYTLKNKSNVEAIIVVSCYASSRRHTGEIRLITGNAKIEDWTVGGTKLGYIINGKWAIRECCRGTKPRIEDYQLWLNKYKLRKEAEERAKLQPSILLIPRGSDIVIKGDTYYHKDAIKLAIRSCGGIPKWDPYDKVWIGKGCNTDQFVSKLKEVLPSEARIEIEEGDD